jgi:hypothetical protein
MKAILLLIFVLLYAALESTRADGEVKLEPHLVLGSPEWLTYVLSQLNHDDKGKEEFLHQYQDIMYPKNETLIEWDCNRKWPQLELFLPINGREMKSNDHYYDYELVWLRSFAMFWPKVSNTSMVVIYDKEVEKYPYISEFRDTFKNSFSGGFKMMSQDKTEYCRRGWDRQQWYMFWADNYSTSDFVGFIDLDVAFLTYVDREDIFEDGKPVVNARGGWHKGQDFVSEWAGATYTVLGILEPFKCMSYFPMVMKTAHLRELREFIENRYRSMGYNLTFNEIFRDYISTRDYSQFNFFCTYAWAFHKDEYTWYYHSQSPKWDGVYPAPFFGQDPNVSQFTPAMRRPKPRVAVHTSYRKGKFTHWSTEQIVGNKNRIRMNMFLQKGVCMVPATNKKYEICNGTDPTKHYVEMHQFEFMTYFDYVHGKLLDFEAEKRYNRIKNCSYSIDEGEAKMIMKPKEKMENNGWS